MASRPKGYGMTAELNEKKAGKYDATIAGDALRWLADVLATTGNGDHEQLKGTLNVNQPSIDEVAEGLKDGVILCHVLNIIRPRSVIKINTSKMAFKQMENIGNFLAGAEALGVKQQDMFQTVDLYEAQNIPQVINGIFALGRKCQAIGWNGPQLGPEEASENKREFTEEQLRAGEGVIGLQAGSNKGASQAGQNFGKTRAIID